MQKTKAGCEYLKEYLKQLVKQSRFEFLEGFKLAPREKAAAVEVLTFASEQDKFPYLPRLGRYLKEKGFSSSSYPSVLKTRGIIDNSKKKSKIWFLSSSVLNSLLELYRHEQPEVPSIPGVQTPIRQLIGKTKAIWESINHERVGNEFLLTSGFVHQLAERFKCRPIDVWDIARKLEKWGLWTRQHLPHQGGILIRFPAKLESGGTETPSESEGEKEITARQLAERIREEIAKIETQIHNLKNLLERKKELLTLIEDYLK